MRHTKPEREFIKTTCARDCYDACGMLVAREDGKVRRVAGDRDHHVARGVLCGKCAVAYNGAWIDAGARLTTPLRRVGPKGTAAFEPISWDTAMTTIAQRLTAIADAGRADRVLHAHYTGTVGLVAGWFPLRFFNRYGATEIDPDTVCNKAGHVALEYVFGTSLDGFDPETAKDAATILVWGANPSHSAPHMHKHWLRETDARIIAIDPLAHDTARDVAALHLKLRPGTDAALAFGFLHVAKANNLLDRAYIDANVLGFDEIDAAIDAADPATTEMRTGVPAALIVEAAIAYAAGPSLLWLGQGMQRTSRGGNAFRALGALAAATGNIGKPGAGICYMNGPATRGIDMSVVTAPHLSRSGAAISHMDLAATLAEPDRADAFFSWNCNPVASSPDQQRLRAALAQPGLFTVACDVFPTDTVAYADIVLPAASFLEFDDIIAPYFHHTLSAQAKVVDPPGDALPNQDIFRRLAAAMNFSESELSESDETLFDRILAKTPFRGGFAELAKQGTVQLFNKPRIQFGAGIFPTPSGKIEIASARAAADGLPRVPEAHADAPPRAGRLRILSPASAWQMNSSYANDAVIRERIGAITMLLHPDEASSRGLSDGEEVILSNDAGTLTLTVTLSDVAQRGVGVVYKGRWPGAEPGGVNVNVLHAGRKSDIGQATCVHSIEVDVRRMGGVS